MEHEQPQWNLREGMIVLGADGGKIGQVVGVQATFFVVEKGWLFPTDYYIPADAIQRVDADTVHLTVPKQEALHQGWDVLPVDEAEALHRDAAAAGTTMGGYTADMGKMVAEVDVKPTEVAAALEHPAPPPVVPEPPSAPVHRQPDDASNAEPGGPEASVETEASSPVPANVSTEASGETGANGGDPNEGPVTVHAQPPAHEMEKEVPEVEAAEADQAVQAAGAEEASPSDRASLAQGTNPSDEAASSEQGKSSSQSG